MLRGSRWEDTSQLAGTRIGFGAPGAATLQQLQPRCTVCSRSKTRPSRACSPRSGPNPAWGASGGRPTPRLGGRPAHSSYGESSHLRRTGEAVPWASSSPHPGPGPPQLSRASGPCRGPGLRPQLRREGGLRGGMSAGDNAVRDGQQQIAPTTVSNPCASRPARTEASAAGPSSVCAAPASGEPTVRKSSLRRSLTPRTPGWPPDAQPRGHPTCTGAARPEKALQSSERSPLPGS